ncbi:GNAT family N-acetyltransferase [Oceaniglobus trochenteri]|uniref:GNAT family N-acetyltransferase n=1 Tax=Oceaniglobus trochenteri TaxID=2763260 RepID=UPI001CFFDF33|nr:GNAT family N-acetyltransferase [Oceaniglobus trochenteri]
MLLFNDCGLFEPGEVHLVEEMFDGWIAGRLARPDHRWFVAGDDAGIAGAGYLAADIMADRVFNLLFLAVHSRARRGGLGDALIAHGEVAARDDAGRLMLIETASGPETAAARALYARRGYALDGRIIGYYGKGIDKLIFRRTL